MLKYVLVIFILSNVFSQKNLLIDDITGKDLQIKFLKLDKDQRIKIKVISPEFYENTNSPAYAWIIDSKTREVVWELEESEYSTFSRNLNEYDDETSLSKGVYEVHFATYMNRNFNGRVEINGLKEFIEMFTKGINGNRIKSRDLQDMLLDIEYTSGEEISKSALKKEQFDSNLEAIYSFTRATDDEYEKYAFEVDDDVKVQITRDGEHDFAMIKNIENGDIVWKMDYYNTKYAGGGIKNRVYNDIITLDEGKYILYYISDDSHSYQEWNQGSTYDPDYYGITVFADKDDTDEFSEIDIDEYMNKNRFLSMVKLRNDEYIKQPFKLNKDMKVRIYAIGEGDRDMVDYSWITNLRTGRKVWEFKYNRSMHAGGAEKNRLIDDIIELEAGEYVAYAKTDDSHAYRDWNSSKPNDRENWGLSLFAVDDSYDEEDVELFKMRDKRNIIAEIIRVQDDEKIRKSFKLNRKTSVHIYAQGEGGSRDMVDFAWIVDEDGHTVWKMRYRDTVHGGGAGKNRLLETTIELDAGEYYVYYRTDDSHSYEDWNSDEPLDEENWGIILYTLK
jgi:hypothetical protein